MLVRLRYPKGLQNLRVVPSRAPEPGALRERSRLRPLEMAAEQGESTSSRAGRAAGGQGQRVHSLRRGASPVPGPRACPRGGLRFPPPSGDALQVINRVGLYCINWCLVLGKQ